MAAAAAAAPRLDPKWSLYTAIRAAMGVPVQTDPEALTASARKFAFLIWWAQLRPIYNPASGRVEGQYGKPTAEDASDGENYALTIDNNRKKFIVFPEEFIRMSYTPRNPDDITQGPSSTPSIPAVKQVVSEILGRTIHIEGEPEPTAEEVVDKPIIRIRQDPVTGDYSAVNPVVNPRQEDPVEQLGRSVFTEEAGRGDDDIRREAIDQGIFTESTIRGLLGMPNLPSAGSVPAAQLPPNNINPDGDGWCFYNTFLAAFAPFRDSIAGPSSGDQVGRAKRARKLAFLLAEKARLGAGIITPANLTASIQSERAGIIPGLGGQSITGVDPDGHLVGFPTQIHKSSLPHIQEQGYPRSYVTDGGTLLDNLYKLQIDSPFVPDAVKYGPVIWGELPIMIPILEHVYSGEFGIRGRTQMRGDVTPDGYPADIPPPTPGGPIITFNLVGIHFVLNNPPMPAIPLNPFERLERELLATANRPAAAAAAAVDMGVVGQLRQKALDNGVYTQAELDAIDRGVYTTDITPVVIPTVSLAMLAGPSVNLTVQATDNLLTLINDLARASAGSALPAGITSLTSRAGAAAASPLAPLSAAAASPLPLGPAAAPLNPDLVTATSGLLGLVGDLAGASGSAAPAPVTLIPAPAAAPLTEKDVTDLADALAAAKKSPVLVTNLRAVDQTTRENPVIAAQIRRLKTTLATGKTSTAKHISVLQEMLEKSDNNTTVNLEAITDSTIHPLIVQQDAYALADIFSQTNIRDRQAPPPFDTRASSKDSRLPTIIRKLRAISTGAIANITGAHQTMLNRLRDKIANNSKITEAEIDIAEDIVSSLPDVKSRLDSTVLKHVQNVTYGLEPSPPASPKPGFFSRMFGKAPAGPQPPLPPPAHARPAGTAGAAAPPVLPPGATATGTTASAAAAAKPPPKPDVMPGWATSYLGSDAIPESCNGTEFITPECVGKAVLHSSAVAQTIADAREPLNATGLSKYEADPRTGPATAEGALNGEKLTRWIQLSDRYPDRTVKVHNPETNAIDEYTVSNPYRARRYRHQLVDVPASFGNPAGEAPAALAQHPEDEEMWRQNALLLNQIAPPEMIADSRMAVALLESLWFCGSSADLASDPRCFPARALGELREYKTMQTQVQRAALAKRVLDSSNDGWKRLKNSVSRILGSFDEPPPAIETEDNPPEDEEEEEEEQMVDDPTLTEAARLRKMIQSLDTRIKALQAELRARGATPPGAPSPPPPVPPPPPGPALADAAAAAAAAAAKPSGLPKPRRHEVPRSIIRSGPGTDNRLIMSLLSP